MRYLFKRIKDFFRYRVFYSLEILFKGYSHTDWWSAYSVFSKRMLPVMKQFRDKKKMGYPADIMHDNMQKLTDMGFIWDESRQTFTNDKALDKDHSDICSDIWQDILNEITFALEHCTFDNDDDCMVPNPLYNPKQKEFFVSEPVEGKEGFNRLIFNEDYGQTHIDLELLKKKRERVQKGLDLMGKYWMNLWD